MNPCAFRFHKQIILVCAKFKRTNVVVENACYIKFSANSILLDAETMPFVDQFVAELERLSPFKKGFKALFVDSEVLFTCQKYKSILIEVKFDIQSFVESVQEAFITFLTSCNNHCQLSRILKALKAAVKAGSAEFDATLEQSMHFAEEELERFYLQNILQSISKLQLYSNVNIDRHTFLEYFGYGDFAIESERHHSKEMFLDCSGENFESLFVSSRLEFPAPTFDDIFATQNKPTQSK